VAGDGHLTLFNTDAVYEVFVAARLHTVLTICRRGPQAAAEPEGTAG
jgi:hypothetical protein